MHEYLRAVGFSSFEDNHQVDDFILKNIEDSFLISSFIIPNGHIYGQYKIPLSSSFGISVVGEQNDNKVFLKEYYFPTIKGYDPLVIQECTIQRHSEKETFAGIVDDYKLGVALIFFVTNPNQYQSMLKKKDKKAIGINRIFLSALSNSGTIILPLEKSIYKEKNNKKDGDDIYTVVDSSFIPYGIECDKYNILGEILSVSTKTNKFTKEKVHEMRISTMGLEITLAINAIDLVGEPKPGRRFKGQIWLQGEIEFLEK
ncbi:MAG: DUF3881 family protein [Eubacteriales bacterium]|nr:DUF3881 family protein [Eubacteriales bacterium]